MEEAGKQAILASGRATDLTAGRAAVLALAGAARALGRGARLAARDLADEWLPRRCALCERRGAAASAAAADALCAACDAALPQRAVPRCACCALPLAVGGRTAPAPAWAACERCVAEPPAFDAAVAAFGYAPPADRWVLAAKGSRPALCAPLGWLVADAARRHPGLPPLALLAPVPPSPARLAERGFDHALAIARAASRALGVPLAPRLLRRPREGARQKALSAHERRENLAGAFAATRRVDGLAIGVVDDVMTTGATLEAAAVALRAAGAAAVVALAAARTG
jgi:predicted amidophosphoribosyltransferase